MPSPPDCDLTRHLQAAIKDMEFGMSGPAIKRIEAALGLLKDAERWDLVNRTGLFIPDQKQTR